MSTDLAIKDNLDYYMTHISSASNLDIIVSRTATKFGEPAFSVAGRQSGTSPAVRQIDENSCQF